MNKLRFIVAGIAWMLAATAFGAEVVRGPYLQVGTPTSMTVKWRTDTDTNAVVRYGTAPGNLNQTASSAATDTDHEITLTGLTPLTRYYYSVGDSSSTITGDSSYTFVTSPGTGEARPVQIWILGDSGTKTSDAAAVRDSYKEGLGNGVDTNLWLMLGDNAYDDGTDSEYQDAVFDMYPEMLRQVPLWPTIGNHDACRDFMSSSTCDAYDYAYYDIFTLPTAGEAGGVASGTEAYYSFDYANIHFVVLDSEDAVYDARDTMLEWLENDLAVTTADWIIAYWHKPPYTGGYHKSDSSGAAAWMREKAVPLLESYGVDLVLTGHNHTYERSYLINGHYDDSNTFNMATMALDSGDGRESGDGAYQKSAGTPANQGAVYVVAGNSGKVNKGTLEGYPAMFAEIEELGSMVLNINGNRLDATFVAVDEANYDNVSIDDFFTITKGPDTEPPVIATAKTLSATQVEVRFTEGLDAASANTASNYALNNGVAVANASLQSDGETVLLTTSNMSEGNTYTLTVNNVQDDAPAPNTIAANSTTTFEYVNEVTVSLQNAADIRDTFISEDNPTTNYGSGNTIEIDGDEPSASAKDVFGLIRWELSSIPSNAQVLSASLTVQVNNETSGAGYALYEAKRNWDEATATWNEYSSGNSWQQAGANGSNDRGTSALGTVAPTSTGSYTVNLNSAGLALVENWIVGATPNYGFVIANPDTGNGLDFASREASSAGAPPRLTIVYATGIADNENPSTPTNLTAQAAERAVALDWDAASDNVSVVYYKVYRDSSFLTSTQSDNYINSGLTPDTSYVYGVSAVDAAGNESVRTEIAIDTLPASQDTEAPSAPTNLRADSVTQAEVVLSWNAATDNVGTTGYRVYRNDVLRASTSATNYTDTTVVAGGAYTYEVQAVDNAGNRSARSAERVVTIPGSTGGDSGGGGSTGGGSGSADSGDGDSGGSSFGTALLLLIALRVGILARRRFIMVA